MTIQETGLPLNVPAHIRAIRPWEAQVREGTITITPELAEHILRDAHYPGQRKVSKADVNVIAEMMRRGLWKLADPISFARFHGNLTLVNGYHRLNGILAYGKPVEFRVAINECHSPEEVRELYYRFDAVMRKRTPEQILSSMDFGASHDVSKTMAKATFGAIGVIINGLTTPKSGTIKPDVAAKLRVYDMRIDACEPWWPTVKKLESCFKRAMPELRPRLLRASTFAVAMVTMRYQEDKATSFWRGVAENDGLKRTDVRSLLVRDLMQRDASSGKMDQGIYSASIAWNAWFEGRNLSMIKVPENYNLRIAGTNIGSKKG